MLINREYGKGRRAIAVTSVGAAVYGGMGSNGSVIRAGIDLAGTWITLPSGVSALALAQAEGNG
ncbi:hypothetical protein PoMZ_02092 [Pyricularia oryzae]|uniref:Uncharacterized protein n=1 Tax=Pyricularia oryzae TaxID=318829 RepID=A0A4P7N3V5_PYROR|nr:hypothetical protein PoMZ_02092 [Pyricularia oryzae]